MAFSGPLPKNKLSPSEIWTLVLHRWGWSLVTPCLGASLPVSSKDPFEKERARVEWFSECSCLIFAAVYGSEDAVAGEEHVSGFLCCHCRDPGCGHRGGLREEQGEGHQQQCTPATCQ